MRASRIIAIGLWCTAVFAAHENGSATRFELDGKVARDGRGEFQVTLFGVEQPFASVTTTDFLSEFKYHGLAPGMYTVSVLRRSIGAVRRTVVVSPSLADAKGVIHTVIRYDPAEAAGNSGGTVSKTVLSVSPSAKNKAAEAQRRLEKHDAEGAQQSLNEALAIAPQFAQAWNALGMIAYQTHDLPHAEKYFTTAIATEPGAFEPLVNLGGVLLSEGRYKEALECNQKALAAHPADVLASAQAGIAYFALGDYDRAEAALLKTLSVDPAHFTKPQLFLGDIYLLKGDDAAAIATWKDFLARQPDAPEGDRLRQRIRKLEQPPQQ